MPIENTSFKVGDRVHCFETEYLSEDYGTVMPDDARNGSGCMLLFIDSIWVKWESDGKILQVQASNVELVNSQQVPSKLTVQTCSALTVQSCIDFLISQGYTVSLSKN